MIFLFSRTVLSRLLMVAFSRWMVGRSVPYTITPDRGVCAGPAKSPSLAAVLLLSTASFILSTFCVRSAFDSSVRVCLKSRQESRTVRYVTQSSFSETLQA